jgi:septum formation protein
VLKLSIYAAYVFKNAFRSLIVMKTPLILASQSLRRQELLRQVGLDFEVIVSNTDETFPPDLPLPQIPIYIAEQKAYAVSQAVFAKQANGCIIAADTIVYIDGQILGKPTTRTQAIDMIGLLAGKRHEVITGVCLLTENGNKKETFSVTTAVYFNPLTPAQIAFYVDTYQPYDKAGGYAIQEWIGMVGINRIEGCYFNVVGLPISEVYKRMLTFV